MTRSRVGVPQLIRNRRRLRHRDGASQLLGSAPPRTALTSCSRSAG